MARKLIDQLALTGAVVFALTVVDAKALKFTVKNGTDDICDNKGKPRVFASLDDLVSNTLTINPAVESIEFNVNTEGVRTFKIPSDPIASATAHRARMTILKSAATARKVTADGLVTLYTPFASSSNAVYKGIYDEAVAQSSALASAITFYTDQITADTAVIGS